MDIYGIYNGIVGAIRVFLHSSRATGRTTALIDNLRPGDGVIFNNTNELERIQHEMRQKLDTEKFRKIHFILVDKEDVGSLIDADRLRGMRFKRIIFDHSWLEQYYLNQIELAHDNLCGYISQKTKCNEQSEYSSDFKNFQRYKWV